MDDNLKKKLIKAKGDRTWIKFFEDITKEEEE